jgi:hypothetical protein
MGFMMTLIHTIAHEGLLVVDSLSEFAILLGIFGGVTNINLLVAKIQSV